MLLYIKGGFWPFEGSHTRGEPTGFQRKPAGVVRVREWVHISSLLHAN